MSQNFKISLDNTPEQVVSNIVGLPTIDIYNSNIINGTSWCAANVASCTVGALYYEHIRTPNITTLHNIQIDLSIEHPTTGGANIYLYKSPSTHTISVAGTGTVVAPINRNLADTAHTTTLQVFAGTVYDSSLTVGNLIKSDTSNLYAPNVSMGRYMLAANSNYTLKYQSVASNTTAHININWYTV